VTDDDELVLPTRVAHASWGDNRFRGYSVAHDIAGRVGHWSRASLSVGYRTLAPDEEAVVEAMAACMLAGDPRIYPLKTVRLAACFGRVAPGLACGHLVGDGARIGPAVSAPAAQLLLDLAAELGDAPADPESITPIVARYRRQRRRFPGFGVPFRDRDERLPALRRLVEAAGRDGGRYWRLAHALDEVLTQWELPMNPAAAVGAGLLDLGFAVEQIKALVLPIADINYLANAYEGARNPAAALQSLPATRLDYRGPAPRVSPRKAESEAESEPDG